ncbi:aldehyde dehydrogenase family protein, partial [Kineococcus rubinsiae]|uniref:aldehyde dehydrogenase family protein n=1 Tax=Kineococcus rubinsiae TaxID=2609562 RepID=UPI001430D748
AGAARAAAAWAGQPGVARGRALLAVAAELESRRAQFVDEVRRGEGVRVTEAVAAVDAAVDDAVRWAGWADKLDVLAPGRRAAPGVVGVLAPEGDVLLAPARAVLPVLAAGGAVVLVASAAAPRPAELLGQAVATALPGGCLTVLHADGGTAPALAAAVARLDARWCPEDLRAVRAAAAGAGGLVLQLPGGRRAHDLDDAARVAPHLPAENPWLRATSPP